ncbi:hypothetical protein MRB53_018679 [Persea americana]|uniref:Uncharacterized protein n=1 Tax=Persea americana TaxID=3435 RepID=A0ACC2M8L5_PERAE|nr:hypothetical protein MRB53_018679 [Persea americana]
MRHMGQWWQKHTSNTIPTGRGGGGDGPITTTGSGMVTTHHGQSFCCLRRLMRKLKKHSKVLCSSNRPTTFHCHYDPLSYARNFDRSSYERPFAANDSDNCHTFSSRFAAAPSSAPPVLAISH